MTEAALFLVLFLALCAPIWIALLLKLWDWWVNPLQQVDPKMEAAWAKGKQVTFMEPEPEPRSGITGKWLTGPPARNMTEAELRRFLVP